MKKLLKNSVAGIAVACGTMVCEAMAVDNFLTDFEQAKQEAATRKRVIFALFTGSDWCPWCKKLENEVLVDNSFIDYAAQNLVLFVADFPRQKELPEEVRQQNERLRQHYQVNGFPTVLLLDESGTVKVTTGYRPGGAANYVKELEQLLAQGAMRSAGGEPVGCGYAVKQRLDYRAIAPDAAKGLLELEKYVGQSGLEVSLCELVRARASQINGCAYCLDMHTKNARSRDESEQRLYLLPVWREAPCYTDRERAALAWTEAVTVLSQNDLPDELFAETRRYFSEKELIDLTVQIISINGWNRLAIASRSPVGIYQPKGADKAK